MKKIITLCFLYLLPLALFAQENLLPNAGFEEFTRCLSPYSTDSLTFVKGWNKLYEEESQPINPCHEKWSEYLKAIESRTGQAAQYFLNWYDDPRFPVANNRSYLVARLKKPLIENGNYFFKMHVRSIYNGLQGFCITNGQGIAFTKKPPKAPDDKGQVKLEAVFESEKIIDTFWTELSGCIKAKGGEEYVVMGNFKNKRDTKVKYFTYIKNNTPVDASLDPNFFNTTVISSYIVDDVELIQLQIDLPQDTAICEGDELILDVKNTLPAKYRWQDGSTIPQYRVTKSGLYTIAIEYTLGKDICKIEQSIKVKVLPKSIPKQLKDTVVCNYKDILLMVGTGRRDDSIRWQNNTTKDTLRVEKKGQYEAQITNSCGTYVETFNVNFANCVIDIYVPNIFSPNGDNMNDVFAPFIHAEFPIVEYEFGIFNRWGIQVFSSRERNISWDGLFLNQLADNGVYAWYVKVKGKLGSKIVHRLESGDVMLAR